MTTADKRRLVGRSSSSLSSILLLLLQVLLRLQLHPFSIIITCVRRPITASALLLAGKCPIVRSATVFPARSFSRFRSQSFASSNNNDDDDDDNTEKIATMIQPSPETFQNLKGVFVGSGSDGMANPKIANLILNELLSSSSSADDESKTNDDENNNDNNNNNKEPEKKKTIIHVVYLGTATYDIPSFAKRQTDCFLQEASFSSSFDVKVSSCNVVDSLDQERILDSADVIVVGGGNTLFAMDRWKTVGLLPHLKRARDRGCVLAGGSAGAICWFDGGHSDSMDPDTYKSAMLAKFAGDAKQTEEKVGDGNKQDVDESSTFVESEKKEWKYIRVPGLGYLPGLVCPHFDRTQSNGVLRETDFDQMLLSRHSGELGICIDHWAALVVDGDSYRVISLDKRTNSDDESASVWIKQVIDGAVQTSQCPDNGKLSDLLRLPNEIRPDEEAVNRCRLDNPDDGPKP